MVQGVNQAGLRVIIDVVYNHTPAAGPGPEVRPRPHRARLLPAAQPDRGRRDLDVLLEHATEHLMMGKLLVDSVLTWAKQYKVDGFRFDLMGHHRKASCSPCARRSTR